MLFRINQVCIYVYVLFNAQFKHDLRSFNVLPEKILLHGTIHTYNVHACRLKSGNKNIVHRILILLCKNLLIYSGSEIGPKNSLTFLSSYVLFY